MAKPRWKLDWNKKLLPDLKRALSDALIEFGLLVERGAKQELRGGHGVLTGTLRRSIHVARPSYNWGSDNVTPSTTTPERGGKEIKPEEKGSKLRIEIGSGMVYAMAVHQGHGSFAGYYYLTRPYDQLKDRFVKIAAAHVKKVK